MSCIAIEEIEKDCERNSGGLDAIWVVDQEEVTSVVENDTTGLITTIAADSTFLPIAIKRKTSNYVEDEQEDFVQGSSVVTTTISLMLHRRSGASSRKLRILSQGQRYLTVLVRDLNGVYWLFQYVQIQNIAEGSGQERADGSKYSVVMIGEAEELAYEVDPTIVPALITPAS